MKSENWEKLYLINSWLVILLFLIIIFVFSFKILFPESKFFLEKNGDLDQIQKIEVNNRYFFLVYPTKYFDFEKIEVNFKDNKENLKNKEIKIFFGNFFQFLPVEEEEIKDKDFLNKFLFFNNQTNFPNGKLVNIDNGVAFISKGELRFFISPEVFERFGFDWEKIEKVFSKEEEGFLVGENINYKSWNLDGLLVDLAGELFLTWDGKLIKISDSLKKELENSFPIVRNFSKEAIFLGNIYLNQEGIGKTFLKKENLTKGGYFFEVEKSFWEMIQKGEIKFQTRKGFNNKQFLKKRLGEIKGIIFKQLIKLHKKYED